MPNKVLRSLLNEKFDPELRFEIERLSRETGLNNGIKHDTLLQLLRDYKVDGIIPLGSGTNRYAFKIDGFVVKVATDDDGRVDNLKEFKMAKVLYPYVIKVHEVSKGGTMLVCEYIQPFISFTEFYSHKEKILDILSELSASYLIGDVGISDKNFANWGIRIGTNDPVCLDFAYVYDIKSEIFICHYCGSRHIMLPNPTYVTLICSNDACSKEYKFSEIRQRLGRNSNEYDINSLYDESYYMQSSNVDTELDEKRSDYLILQNKKCNKDKQTIESEIEYDNFHIIKEENRMDVGKLAAIMNSNGSIRTTATVIDNGAKVVNRIKVDAGKVDIEIPKQVKIESTPVVEDSMETIDELVIKPEFTYEIVKNEEAFSILLKAISKVSNKVSRMLIDSETYSMLEYKDHQITENTISGKIQNCIYKSLCHICKVGRYSPDGNIENVEPGPLGTNDHDIATMVSKIIKLSNMMDNGSAFDDAVYEIKFTKTELDNWLINFFTPRAKFKCELYLDDKNIEILESCIESAFLVHNEETCCGHHSCGCDDEDDDYMHGDECEMGVWVYVMRKNEDNPKDLILVQTTSGVDSGDDQLSIPFYVDLDKVSVSNAYGKQITHHSNKSWDWLTHIAPSMMEVSTPTQYTNDYVDDNLLKDDTLLSIILNETSERIIKGVYVIKGVFEHSYETGDDVECKDATIIPKLNMLFREFIAGKPFSRLHLNIQTALSMPTDEQVVTIEATPINEEKVEVIVEPESVVVEEVVDVIVEEVVEVINVQDDESKSTNDIEEPVDGNHEIVEGTSPSENTLSEDDIFVAIRKK